MVKTLEAKIFGDEGLLAGTDAFGSIELRYTADAAQDTLFPFPLVVKISHLKPPLDLLQFTKVGKRPVVLVITNV